ncbi:hypothetical protein D3C78_1030690 [compost metagenome]
MTNVSICLFRSSARNCFFTSSGKEGNRLSIIRCAASDQIASRCSEPRSLCFISMYFFRRTASPFDKTYSCILCIPAYSRVHPEENIPYDNDSMHRPEFLLKCQNDSTHLLLRFHRRFYSCNSSFQELRHTRLDSENAHMGWLKPSKADP